MKGSLTFVFRQVLLASFISLTTGGIFAQNLPLEMHFSADGKRLVTGGNPSEGFYDEAVIQVFELIFSQPNYWTLLTNNYQSGTDLPATMVVNGDTLPAKVGVRFKGQTSYQMSGNTQKKSFNITIDYEDPTQDLEGYETLNLNNCFQDPSFLREVLYLHQGRKHIPALKASYVHLYINGASWGIYPNVQGLNGQFLDEWFLSNDGTRWRALKTIGGGGGPGGPGGGGFGTGFSSLNYLGTTDTAEYKKYYTLKKANKTNPWDDLVKTCVALNNTPLNALEDSVKKYLDLDRTLWFLATEIMFSDDDGYVHKGGMDYYLYWEPETGRMVPLEYDGNSAMLMNNVSWSPFYNQTDIRFPLLNRLLAVPSIRQRYLAHVRTMIEESLDQTEMNNLIDTYFSLIDPFVQADNKKLYSYSQFVSEKQVLKNYVQQRRNNLLANAEVNTQGLAISAVASSADSATPAAGQEVTVTASVSGVAGVFRVNLFYAPGFVGVFEKTQMFDDGAHDDGAAGDGVFGGTIPGFGNDSYVRYYIEALANNTPKTATYQPKGAEHDVYIYKVGVTEYFDSEVVINEIMASNTAAVADQNGEFDDWIELYNNASTTIDLSGWYLTDDVSRLDKWTFPEGTFIDGNGFLIVWADENGSQPGLHANFKLAASGETLYLLDPALRIGQEIVFGSQVTDLGYARVPNGTGDFVIQGHTFNKNNDGTTATGKVEKMPAFLLFPNPASGVVTLRSFNMHPERLTVLNSQGQVVLQKEIAGEAAFNAGNWAPGLYVVSLGEEKVKLLVR
jgi:hypothetical protein